MSYRGIYKIDGYFEYVVPPLEGFWWQKKELKELITIKKMIFSLYL